MRRPKLTTEERLAGHRVLSIRQWIEELLLDRQLEGLPRPKRISQIMARN